MNHDSLLSGAVFVCYTLLNPIIVFDLLSQKQYIRVSELYQTIFPAN